ncbi:hypothetical protein COCNU_10G003430 [Cocos nucifera]|uniref:Uncharacterized protein n=1 Tax=Cocos nucifera TaxID=13894 RepID=A0A8K0N8N9_COCNU|nr:hypothetical protein COCNU_10G003430 [Cocos nucifera]
MTMSEFLESAERDGREAELVHWVDVDKKDLYDSAPFYIQPSNGEDSSDLIVSTTIPKNI